VTDPASRSREINEANIPAEQPAPKTDARLSRSHEHGRRSSGFETPARKGPQTPHGNHSSEAAVLTKLDRSLPRSRRIRKRAEYLQLQRSGRRRVCRSFVVITRPATSQGSRIGITASRRTGGAVVRNRVKRLVREFFRNYRWNLTPQKDVLVIARPQAANLSYDELKHELGGVLNIDVDQ
jgi:ribonuclease P protein component